MTPKEKANELTDKFYYGAYLSNYLAKKCALIAVEEILNGHRKLLPSSRKYWEEVKREIVNLMNT